MPSRASKALPEGAGGNVDAGALVHRGMALQHGALLAQRVQLGFREEADACETGILNGAHMALGENHTICGPAAGILRVHVHILEVAGSNKVRCGKGSARMPGLRFVDHVNDLHAHLHSGVFQFLNGNVFHKNHLIECIQ